MPKYTLTRHEVHDRNNSHGAWIREVVTGHPPIPDTALPLLRKHLCGWPKDQGPIRWHNVDGNAWSAVHDLHKADNHEDAVKLATLLRWCERRGGGTNERIVLWAIDDAPPCDMPDGCGAGAGEPCKDPGCPSVAV